MPVFTTATASAAARRSHAPDSARNGLSSLKKVRIVEDLVYRVLISILQAVSLRTAPAREDARIICDLVRAFDIMLERIRIMTMTPAPKAADAPKKPAKRLALRGPMIVAWKPPEQPKPQPAGVAS
jgi:hypothetical protein